MIRFHAIRTVIEMIAVALVLYLLAAPPGLLSARDSTATSGVTAEDE